jgi:hypothetical protein
MGDQLNMTEVIASHKSNVLQAKGKVSRADIDVFHGNANKKSSAWKYKWPICFVSNNPLDAVLVFDYVRAHDGEVLPLGANFFKKFYDQLLDVTIGGLILSIDDFDGISPIFGKLRDFRTYRPSVPVILVSRNFKSDDLSLERLAICDVSVKLPLSSDKIEKYLSTASINNKEWVKRLVEIESERDEERLINGFGCADMAAGSL